MPKLGNKAYELPARDIDDCVKLEKEAWEKARKYVFKREEFADAIGQSAAGGNFNLLVGSLSMYGLAETGGGDVRISELAKTAIFGKNGESEDAKKKALRNIKLFADLLDRFGTDMTDEQIGIFLKNDAGVDIGQLESQTKTVRLLLKRNALYLTAVRKPDEGNTDRGERENTMLELGDSKAVISTSFGQIKVIDRATLEIAKKYLEVVEQQMNQPVEITA